MPKFNALIFDMDGVIVDSEPLQAEATRRACTHWGLTIPDELFEDWIGRRLEYGLKKIVRHYQAYGGRGNPPTVAELRDRRRPIVLDLLQRKLEPVKGAPEFVGKAKQHYRIALATSGKRANVKAVLQKFRLTGRFEVIITGGSVRHGKPHPEMYQKTLQRLNIPAVRTAVIEDAETGVQSAKAAGCTVFAITTSFPAKRLLQAGADKVVKSYAELEPVLLK